MCTLSLRVLLCRPSGPCEACVSSTTVPGGGTHTDGLNHVGRLEVWAGAENIFSLSCCVLVCASVVSKLLFIASVWRQAYRIHHSSFIMLAIYSWWQKFTWQKGVRWTVALNIKNSFIVTNEYYFHYRLPAIFLLNGDVYKMLEHMKFGVDTK